MAKKKPSAVEKRSKGPYMAIAAGVCFALAALSVALLAAGGTVPALYGLAAVLRGLGGDLRFALPLVFFWFGLRLARAARGERLPLWQILLDVLTALCLFGALHVFWGEMIDASGYHVQSALGYGDFLKKSYDLGVGGGALGALWAALPT